GSGSSWRALLAPPDPPRRPGLYGAVPEPGPPGISARLLEFGEELRSEGVAIGTSELLDAFSVLREVPWTAPEDFREALAATLAIAAFGRQGEGSGVFGVDVQRIRRALGLRSEPQPELPPDDPRHQGLPRDALRRFEAILRRELERAQIERTETLPPSRPLN